MLVVGILAFVLSSEAMLATLVAAMIALRLIATARYALTGRHLQLRAHRSRAENATARRGSLAGRAAQAIWRRTTDLWPYSPLCEPDVMKLTARGSTTIKNPADADGFDREVTPCPLARRSHPLCPHRLSMGRGR
jgi:hypothetical protein